MMMKRLNDELLDSFKCLKVLQSYGMDLVLVVFTAHFTSYSMWCYWWMQTQRWTEEQRCCSTELKLYCSL